MSTSVFSQTEEQAVLKVIDDFFHTMETKDSIAFNKLFLENAYAYSIREHADSTIVRNSRLKANASEKTLKERLRQEEITIHATESVAAVWAPYDFWIDNVYSHCGQEVFTLIKKNRNWKIASLTYSVEIDSCK